MFRVLTVASVMLVFAGVSLCQERGQIISIQAQTQTRFIPGYPGGDGVVANPGVTVRDQWKVYRIETEMKFYDIQAAGKNKFKLGDQVSFKIDDKRKYVSVEMGKGHKPMRFLLVGEELKKP